MIEQLIKENFFLIRKHVCGAIAFQYSVDVSNLFSDVLEKAWKFRDSFHVVPEKGEQRSFINWLFAIAHRAALDERRKMKRRRPLLMDDFKMHIDLLMIMAEHYEEQLEDIPDLNDRDRILKYIHAVYGDASYYTVLMLRDGADYTEIRQHFKQNKSTIYRRLMKIKNDLSK